MIATTVREAFEEGVVRGELPKDAKAQLALARMAFIPHLARVNPAGQFVRRIATRAEIPVEARPLIDRFAERRLLIRDRRKIAGEDVEVIEVAHEAMLREWRELHDALLEEREFLAAKGQLEQDVAEWQAASERLKSGTLLSGSKLLRARDWLITRPQDLSVDERQFIKASSDQELSQRRSRRAAVLVAFILILGFAGYAIYEAVKATGQSRIAEAEKLRAEQNAKVAGSEREHAESEKERADGELKKAQRTQSLFLADLAQQQRSAGDAGTAVLLALEALPNRANGTTRPYAAEAEFQLDGALRDLRELIVLGGHQGRGLSAAFSPDGKRIVTQSKDKTARLWDGETGKPIGEPLKHEGAVWSAAFSPDGGRIVTASADQTARLWDAGTRSVRRSKGTGHSVERGVQPRRRAHCHRV